MIRESWTVIDEGGSLTDVEYDEDNVLIRFHPSAHEFELGPEAAEDLAIVLQRAAKAVRELHPTTATEPIRLPYSDAPEAA